MKYKLLIRIIAILVLSSFANSLELIVDYTGVDDDMDNYINGVISKDCQSFTLDRQIKNVIIEVLDDSTSTALNGNWWFDIYNFTSTTSIGYPIASSTTHTGAEIDITGYVNFTFPSGMILNATKYWYCGNNSGGNTEFWRGRQKATGSYTGGEALRLPSTAKEWDWMFRVYGATSSDNINLSIPNPLNNSFFNTSIINFNLTANSTYDFSCNLMIKDIFVEISPISNGINRLVTYNATFENGDYNYSMFCFQNNDTSQNETTLTYNFSVDVPPAQFYNVYNADADACILDKTTPWLIGYIFIILLVLLMWILNIVFIKIPFFSILIGLAFIFVTLNIYACNTWVGMICTLFGIILMAGDFLFIIQGKMFRF